MDYNESKITKQIYEQTEQAIKQKKSPKNNSRKSMDQKAQEFLDALNEAVLEESKRR